MNKLKKILCTSVLSLSVISCYGMISYAAEIPKVDQLEYDNSIGGWDEEEGYFENPQAYSKAMEDISVPYSSPKHTGQAEEGVSSSGNSQRRSHGWTTWQGVYHYTTAQMEVSSTGKVLTTSGRQWGTSGTEAISPWFLITSDTRGAARTYYGN